MNFKMWKRWWKTVNNETKSTCGECSYFHMVVCGYFDQYANADDYACGHFYDECPDDYKYEP